MSIVFIDGSVGAVIGRSVQGPATSGMCVVHELLDGTLLFDGYAGALVDTTVGGEFYIWG